MKIWGKLMRECHRVQLKITYFFLGLEKNKRLSSSESVSFNYYYSSLKTTPLTFWSTSTWGGLSKRVRQVGIWNFPVHQKGSKQKSPRAALLSLSLTGWILNFKRQKRQSPIHPLTHPKNKSQEVNAPCFQPAYSCFFSPKNVSQPHNNLPSTRLNLLWHKTCFQDKPPPLQPASLVGKMEWEIPPYITGAEKSEERASRNLTMSSPLSLSSSFFPWTHISHRLPAAAAHSFYFSRFLFNFLSSTQVH